MYHPDDPPRPCRPGPIDDDDDDNDDNDNDQIYQPNDGDVYNQSCKYPKAHDEVDLPGKY